MTDTFPIAPLDVHVEIFLLGEWIDMGPFSETADDFYTDEYLDEYLGRTIWRANRLPAQEIQITHGRRDESSAVTPSSTSVVLWDDDGYLTPNDPRSPWWADDGSGWGRNTPLRIRVGDTVVFHGEVSQISQGWVDGDLSDDLTDEEKLDLASVDEVRRGYSIVTVTASGIMRRLGQGRRALRSPLFRLATKSTNAPHVANYWPMEDGSDATFLASGLASQMRPSPSRMLFSGGALSPSSDSTLPGSEALPSASSGAFSNWQATVRPDSGYAGGFDIDVFIRVPSAPDADTELVRMIDVTTDGTAAHWVVDAAWDGLNRVPIVRLIAYDDTGDEIDRRVRNNPEFCDGQWWQMRLSLRDAGGSTDYDLWWGSVSAGVDPVFHESGTWVGTLGDPKTVGGMVSNCPDGGFSIGHLIVSDGGLGLGWLVPADSAWVGETALSRARRLCREEDVPLDWTISEATTETVPMGAQEPGQLISLLDECWQSDAAILCEQRDAVGLTFRTRRSLYNQTPKMVLVATDSDIANPFEPTFDDESVRNDVTVTRRDGTSVNKVDEDSIARVGGAYEESYTLSLAYDATVHHHAGWRLHDVVLAGIRFPQVSMDLGIRPELIDAWLTMRVGDRLQITGTPPQDAHTLTVVDLMLQGWTETLSAFGWTVTLNCSPYAPWVIGRWDDSDYRWGLPSTLADPIDADDTGLQVAIPNVTYDFAGTSYTPKWTTTNLPLDFLIGECEQVTATDIDSPSGGEQHFVVTRNVNGLARAHEAGAKVELFQPAVLGL